MRWGLIAIALAAVGQDYHDAQMERVSGGHRFTESPLWSKATTALLFCDVSTNQILAFVPGKGTLKYREEMAGPSAIAYDTEGRLLVAQTRNRRIIRLYPGDDKKFDVVVERFEGKRLNAPNDLVVRKDGQVYFTDPAFGAQTETRELDFNGIYHLTPKGELSIVARPKGRPNGITLSPNGRTLYVSIADERRILAWDLDGRGRAGNERVFAEGIEGPPAGMKMDEKGNLYVAANQVLVLGPDGKQLHAFPLPDKPSNLAFGDEDRQSLYITAKGAVYRARMKVKGAASESQ
jgi:gluconolactonase